MVHAFLASGSIYAHFIVNVDLFSVAAGGGFIYICVMMIFLMNWSGGVRYYCRDCKTDTKIETNAAVGEYETKPDMDEVAREQNTKWQHWKILKRVGAVCSIIALVVTVILYLASSQS